MPSNCALEDPANDNGTNRRRTNRNNIVLVVLRVVLFVIDSFSYEQRFTKTDTLIHPLPWGVK